MCKLAILICLIWYLNIYNILSRNNSNKLSILDDLTKWEIFNYFTTNSAEDNLKNDNLPIQKRKN